MTKKVIIIVIIALLAIALIGLLIYTFTNNKKNKPVNKSQVNKIRVNKPANDPNAARKSVGVKGAWTQFMKDRAVAGISKLIFSNSQNLCLQKMVKSLESNYDPFFFIDCGCSDEYPIKAEQVNFLGKATFIFLLMDLYFSQCPPGIQNNWSPEFKRYAWGLLNSQYSNKITRGDAACQTCIINHFQAKYSPETFYNVSNHIGDNSFLNELAACGCMDI